MCVMTTGETTTAPVRSRWAALGKPAVWMIVAYQHSLGHIMGGRCRFHPTCSHYGREAFETHAPWRAAWLTAWRIARCHPWGGSGIDPVPPVRGRRDKPADPAGAGDGGVPIR